MIINIVDKFKKKNAALSPDKNINTSTKINKSPIKYFSNFCFCLIRNKENNKGNNLDKYEPKIKSSLKNDETRRLLSIFIPNKFCPLKY